MWTSFLYFLSNSILFSIWCIFTSIDPFRLFVSTILYPFDRTSISGDSISLHSNHAAWTPPIPSFELIQFPSWSFIDNYNSKSLILLSYFQPSPVSHAHAPSTSRAYPGNSFPAPPYTPDPSRGVYWLPQVGYFEPRILWYDLFRLEVQPSFANLGPSSSSTCVPLYPDEV